MAQGRTIAILLALAACLLGACVASQGPSLPPDPMTLPPQERDGGSAYILGEDGKIKVFVWEGEAPIKKITLYPTGEVVEELVDTAVLRPRHDARLTAVAYKGSDFYRLPLTAKPLLTYGEEYVIGPEDVLEIDVWNNPALSKRVPVRPDGKISMPLIRDVTVAGMTALQVREKLTEAFGQFVGSPEVTVTIAEINSYKIFVQGEVAHPGAYPIKSRTTLVQVIAMSGGFTQWAEKSNIVVIRITEKGTERLPADYKRIVSGDDPDVPLRPGDTVIVP